MFDTLLGSEKKALEILGDNPFAAYMEIADKLAVGRKMVSWKIRVLKDKGVIIRIGSAKKDTGKRYKRNREICHIIFEWEPGNFSLAN